MQPKKRELIEEHSGRPSDIYRSKQTSAVNAARLCSVCLHRGGAATRGQAHSAHGRDLQPTALLGQSTTPPLTDGNLNAAADLLFLTERWLLGYSNLGPKAAPGEGLPSTMLNHNLLSEASVAIRSSTSSNNHSTDTGTTLTMCSRSAAPVPPPSG